jgi:transposase
MTLSSRSIAVSGSCGRWVPTIPTTSQLGLLLTVPGIAWVLGYTIAAEIGDIHRFASPLKLCGYTGLCPTSVSQVTGTTAARSPRPGPATVLGP